MIFNFHFENDLDARHLEEQRKALDLWLNDYFFVNHDYNHDQLIKTTIATTTITNVVMVIIIFSCVFNEHTTKDNDHLTAHPHQILSFFLSCLLKLFSDNVKSATSLAVLTFDI